MISLTVNLSSENKLEEAITLLKEIDALVDKLAEVSSAKFVELIFPLPYTVPIFYSSWINGVKAESFSKDLSKASRLLDRGNITVYFQVSSVNYVIFTELLEQGVKSELVSRGFKVDMSDLISDEDLLNPDD